MTTTITAPPFNTSSSSSSSSSSSMMVVPRRPFGDRFNNPRLSSTVPIIGLGCSSFSTFFWTDADVVAMSTGHEHHDTTVGGSGGGDVWTPETLNRNHPRVQEWIRTIHYAVVECGITLLDTAPWYGHGTSEVVLGWAMPEILKDSNVTTNHHNHTTSANSSIYIDRVIPREDLTINTKVGRYEADPQHQFDYSFDATIQSVQRSLQRMNLSYIDVLQLHDPEFAPTLQVLLEETIPAMIQCQQEGKCKALGMTGYPLHVQHLIFQRTLDFCKNHHRHDGNSDSPIGIWDQALTYGHFNLHDTSLVSQPLSLLRSFSSSSSSSNNGCNNTDLPFADYCQQHEIAIMTAAPLSLGLLTPQGPPSWHPASLELKQACRKACLAAQEHGVNIATLAMVVAMAHPNIPCTILGMKNVEEVQVAATAANRFHQIKQQSPSSSPPPTTTLLGSSNNDWNNMPCLENILIQVLTKEEFQVWKILQDPIDGPFAQIWKSGQYQWDGIQQAKEFWKQVDGVEYKDWASS